MGYTYLRFGGLAAGLYLLAKIWTLLEQPLMEFVLLGLVPGTDFRLGFGHILIIALFGAAGWYLAARRLHLALIQAAAAKFKHALSRLELNRHV